MITVCTGCQARYRLDAAKVPSRRIRVRCPGCATVFDLDGTRREEASTPAVTSGPLPVSATPAPADDLQLEPAAAVFERSPRAAASPAPAAPRPPLEPATRRPAAGPASAAAQPAAASATAVADAQPGRRRRRDKTEMLARALVSDILVYNQAARDKALAEGNLLEALGPEIKKSWELYKEKVGAEAATASNYFKDALNDILADGQQIF